MIAAFFDIYTIALTCWGHAMSYLELFGVLSGLLAVSLAARARVANFYVGLINTVVYCLLFYQSQLYASMFLQAVFFMLALYGIYKWSAPSSKKVGRKEELKITRLSFRQRLAYLSATLVFGIICGYVLLRFTVKEQQNPTFIYYWDAVLTIGSIFAQYLLARKKIDNWYFWILINLNYVVLYAVTDLQLTAVLYAIYIFIAIHAVFTWEKELNSLPSKEVS